MANITKYEKRFRNKGQATFEIIGMTLDFDEIKSGGWNLDGMDKEYEATWDVNHWECYNSSADVDFSATTLNKVKQNIAQFLRGDPAIESYKKIIVK